MIRYLSTVFQALPAISDTFLPQKRTQRSLFFLGTRHDHHRNPQKTEKDITIDILSIFDSRS